MKQIISILLLVCANLILLAHSAVPHHHHNGVVVDSSHSTDSHHHHEVPMSEDCLLDNIFSTTILNSQKNGIAVNRYPLTAIITDTSEEVIPESETIRHRPYLLLRHSFLEIHSNGLCAPPVC